MNHAQTLNPTTLDFLVQTELSRGDVHATNAQVLVRVVEKVADAIAVEILRRHKGKLVMLAMRNPDLIGSCRRDALLQADAMLDASAPSF